MHWQHYQVMTSVQETVHRLAESSGKARVVAGGTDLIVQMLEMDAEEESLTLLDISRIEEMRDIQEYDSYILIGAAVTMAELAASPVIQAKARALGQGASWLGSPQIRTVATIGGNVVSAQPAADTSIPLVALGAEACIVSPDGEQHIPVEALFQGVGRSTINPSWEVITHFRVPLSRAEQHASAMGRLTKRKVFTLPQLSVAVWLEVDENTDRISQARIALGPVAPTPLRPKNAEEVLAGAPLRWENVNKAAALAREDSHPRNSLRGGVPYRKDMAEVLTRRALVDALSQLDKGLE